jgi:hypothetical protein
VLLFSLQLCRAQIVVPSTLSFNLGDPETQDGTQLWDLSGSYQLDVQVVNKNGAATEMGLEFDLLQDGKGRLSNPTNFNVHALTLGDSSVFTVATHITGKVTGSGGVAQVHFTIRFNGDGTLAGQPANSFSGSLSVDAETDQTTGLLLATKKCKFSASVPGSINFRGTMPDFTAPMPNGTNATWNLTLQLVGLTKIRGTGLVTTPSRALGLNLTGAFKNGVITARAHGANSVQGATSNGSGLKAKFQTADPFDSIVLTGKFLGQKLFISTSTN